jgi:tetraacyldisaccharide 4'-kinase
MSVLKLLLLPLSFCYKLITDLRNHLYDIGNKTSVQFDRLVISVGNLTVGGTGKTPFVELLIRMLGKKHHLAVLSRGYGRKTRGYRLAASDDDATTLGDEPFQYYKKFGKEIIVAVGEARALAIPEILFDDDQVEVIVLDDAFQHRSVRPGLNILLSDFGRPFYSDMVLPAGRLRESRKHARRADMVVVTKCPPDLDHSSMNDIEKQIQRYAGQNVPVYFSGIRYLEPIRFFGDQPFVDNVFLFSGIAHHVALEKYVRANFNLLTHKKFPDHHYYSESDIEKLVREFDDISTKNKCLLTTEKDMVRLLSMKQQFLAAYPVFYLPIELYFLENEDSFAAALKLHIDTWTLENKQEKYI